MSNSIRSWLVPALIQHHKVYGDDLEREEQGHYVQILEFHSHRSPANPHEQIIATVADKTHRFKIRFDVVATDECESREGSLGELAEPLTSHVRTIVRIKAFKFSVLPPRTRKKYDVKVPEVILDVMSWEVRSGDRTETVYWPGAKEINQNDEEAAHILMQWWGESNGSPDLTDQVTKEWKARRAAKSPTPEQSLHTPVISQTKTSLFNNYVEGKKTAPAALWTISADQRQELDMIKYFGLDPVKLEAAEGAEIDAEGETDDLESLPEEPVAEDELPWSPSPTPPPREIEPRQTPLATSPHSSKSESRSSPVMAANSGPIISAVQKASVPDHSSPLSPSFRSRSPDPAPKDHVGFAISQLDNDGSDSDEDLNVRPIVSRKAAPKSDQPFDPLTFIHHKGSAQLSQVEPAASLEVEELPGSLDSESRFDLAAASARRASHSNVLVADSDREGLKADTSMESANQSQNQSQNQEMLEPPPAAVSEGSKRKRSPSPVVAIDAEISMEADDEASLSVPTISTTPRETPGLRDALAFINPINLFSSSKAPPSTSSKVKRQELESNQSSPSMLSRFMPRRQARDEESRSGSSVSEEEEQRQDLCSYAEPGDGRAIRPAKRMRQGTPLEESPTQPVSRTRAESPREAIAPGIKTAAPEARTKALAGRRSRLNGFELNLVPSDGLAEDKVRVMLEQARKTRANMKK